MYMKYFTHCEILHFKNLIDVHINLYEKKYDLIKSIYVCSTPDLHQFANIGERIFTCSRNVPGLLTIKILYSVLFYNKKKVHKSS